MNITLMAFGSRGDIQPFLALAVALKERGHAVTLAAPTDFESLIKAHAVPYAPILFNAQEFVQRSTSNNERKRQHPFAMFQTMRDALPEIKRSFAAAADALIEAARGADLIFAHGLSLPFSYSIHQHLNIPLMLGIAAPVVSTRYFPSPMFKPIPIGGRFYNPLTYEVLTRGIWFAMKTPMNEFRRRIDLPPITLTQLTRVLFDGQFPLIMHYSSYLNPAPPDWNPNVHVAGAWRLPAPADWTPPEALSQFLAQGDAPVYVGFGSMIVPKAAHIMQTITDALRTLKLRGVVQSGWGGLTAQDDHMITIGDAPHDWLFPRMQAVIHHGGSGTTHSALMAGKPSLVIPIMADQPFWGRRLAALGVAPPMIPPKKVTPEGIVAALRAMTQDTAMRQRAADYGALLRAEDGLGAAVSLIEQHVMT